MKLKELAEWVTLLDRLRAIEEVKRLAEYWDGHCAAGETEDGGVGVDAGLVVVVRGRPKRNRAAYQKAWAELNPERWGAIRRRFSARRRLRHLLAMELLGGACTCCGEPELAFLAQDHIADDGWRDRLLGRRSGAVRRVADILFRGAHSRLQLLCCNCNHAKAVVGSCPHLISNEDPDHRAKYRAMLAKRRAEICWFTDESDPPSSHHSAEETPEQGDGQSSHEADQQPTLFRVKEAISR